MNAVFLHLKLAKNNEFWNDQWLADLFYLRRSDQQLTLGYLPDQSKGQMHNIFLILYSIHYYICYVCIFVREHFMNSARLFAPRTYINFVVKANCSREMVCSEQFMNIRQLSMNNSEIWVSKIKITFSKFCISQNTINPQKLYYVNNNVDIITARNGLFCVVI